ncbi:MAG: hypothetical protein ACAF41_31230 [Leptolyngbya sp. BL-A-14]
MASPSPLSVGNVVSAGFRLYGANAKQYLMIALYGTLWLLLPFVVAIAVVAVFAVVQNYYATLGLIIPALLVLFFYTLAKYLVNSALIARLAFGEITNQPEPLKEAQRFVQSRQWSFLGASFLMGLIYMVVMVVFYLVLAIVVVGLIFSVGGFQLFQNPTPETLAANAGTIVLLALLGLALLLVFLAFLLWFAARFVSVELPLAVEPDSSATQTIGRIWSLTKGSAWRIALILFVTGLVTLPIQLVLQIVVGSADAIIRAAGVPPTSSTYTALSLLITYAVSFALSIVVLPLWQIIKAVIYYDLRSRREGLGLQLRDRGAQF